MTDSKDPFMSGGVRISCSSYREPLIPRLPPGPHVTLDEEGSLKWRLRRIQSDAPSSTHLQLQRPASCLSDCHVSRQADPLADVTVQSASVGQATSRTSSRDTTSSLATYSPVLAGNDRYSTGNSQNRITDRPAQFSSRVIHRAVCPDDKQALLHGGVQTVTFTTVTGNELTKKPETISVPSRESNSERLSDSAANVSKVFEPIRARLISRKYSRTAETQFFHRPLSSYTKSSDNLGLEGGEVFQFPPRNPHPTSPSKDTFITQTLEQPSEKASSRYRETCNEILRSANINLLSRVDQPVDSTEAVDCSALPISPSSSSWQDRGSSLSSEIISAQVKQSASVTSPPGVNLTVTEPGTGAGRTVSEASGQTTYTTPTIEKDGSSLLSMEANKNDLNDSMKDYDKGINCWHDTGDRCERGCDVKATEVEPKIRQVNRFDTRSDGGQKWLTLTGDRARTSTNSKVLNLEFEDKILTENLAPQNPGTPSGIDRCGKDSFQPGYFDLLERGHAHTISRSRVGFLTAKFGESNTETNHLIRRSLSLNSLAKNSQAYKKTGKVLLQDSLELLPQGSHEPAGTNSSSVAAAKIDLNAINSESIRPQQIDSTCNDRLQPISPPSITVNADRKTIDSHKRVDQLDFSDFRQKPSDPKNKALADSTVVGQISAGKNSKPIKRCWSETYSSRPRMYTSHLEIQIQPVCGERNRVKIGTNQVKGKDEEQNELIGAVDSRIEDSRKFTTIVANFSRNNESCPQLSGSEFQSLPTSLTTQTREHNATMLNEGCTPSPRRNHLPTQDPAGTPRSSHPRRHKSFTYSRQTPSTMEETFRKLLEDLERISISEGSHSDPDLSGAEDALSLSGGSNSSPEYTTTFGPEGSQVHKDKDYHILKKSNPLGSEHTSRGPVDVGKSVDDGLGAVVLTTDTCFYGNSGAELRKDNSLATSPLKSAFMKQRQILSHDSSLAQAPSSLIERALPTMQTPMSSSSESPMTTSNEAVGEKTRPTDMDIDTPDTNCLDSDAQINSTDLTCAATDSPRNTNKLRSRFFNVDLATGNITDSPGNTNIFSTVTFNNDQVSDGTIILHSVAEDFNQNRVVTVRSQMQRTPSNAEEETRDTTVEINTISPGGALLVEKDVVQTSRRLTPRGSNYYTRSAYTTRTRRDRDGEQTIQHQVCVETNSSSASQGKAWSAKTTAVAILQGTHNSNVQHSPQAFGGDQAGISETEDAENNNKTNFLMSAESLGHSEEAGKGGGSEEDQVSNFSNECRGQFQKPPVFRTNLTDTTVMEGHSTVLSCVVSDATSVTWYKDGVVQKHSADFKQTFDGNEARLQIGEVFLDDKGEYACVAKNAYGEQRSSCILNVNECDGETVVVPMFLTQMPDTILNAGETLTLECDVIASPEAIISWQKDGKELGQNMSFSTCYDGRVSRLEVSDMKSGDGGCYTCVAVNPAGQVSLDAHVTVQDTSKAPHFVSVLSDVIAIQGRSVILRCELTGSPQPTVTWRKDAAQLSTSHNFIQSYNNGVARFEILGASKQDGGRYECVAKNSVSEISCQCLVQVIDSTAPDQSEQKGTSKESTVPEMIKPRFVKKLSEPRPVDIITAVINRASSHGAQRAHSFSPASMSVQRENLWTAGGLGNLHSSASSVGHQRTSETVSERANATSQFLANLNLENLTNGNLHKSTNGGSQNDANSVSQYLANLKSQNVIAKDNLRDVENVSSKSSANGDSINKAVVGSQSSSIFSSLNSSNLSSHDTATGGPHFSGSGNTPQHSELHGAPRSEESRISILSRTSSLKLGVSEPHTSPSPTSSLGRSGSLHINRNKTSPSWPRYAVQTNENIKPAVWTPPSRDPRVTITDFISSKKTELPPFGHIPENKPVCLLFVPSSEKEDALSSPMTKCEKVIGTFNSENFKELDQMYTQEQELASALPCAQPAVPAILPINSTTSSSHPQTLSSCSAMTRDSHHEAFSVDLSRPARLQAPRVSALREQFLKNDQAVARPETNKPAVGGVRRWHSLPAQEVRPTVCQRKPDAVKPLAMPSYDHINDEDELHKMMNATEDFEERKKIRARLRDIREKQREEMEAKRKQREAEAEDLVKKKFERAEEEKKKKMEAYKQQGPTHERDSKYHEVTQNLIQEKFKAAEEEKARKMAAYSSMATKTGPGGETTTTTTTSTTVQKTPGGGTKTVTQKTTETTTKAGFGGTAYGKPAEITAQELTEQLMRSSGPGVSGHIIIRKEAWNSTNGVVEKSEKSHSWGAKPQGAKSAMAAFKQMDNATTPEGAAKPKAMARSPSAIKQMLLDWTKAMTQGYPNVEVTNFSSSWNNGMAFCALIHHFFPNAFDFNKLDPKQRRYNFTLAFDTAEKEADIAPLLDVEDMVKMKNPDWKCVFTYVQSIYRHLKDHENNKAGPIEP